MQRIINALLAFKNDVLFIVLLIFSIIFLSQRSYFHQAQISKINLYLTGHIHETKNNLMHYFQLRHEIEELIQENLFLKSKNLLINESEFTSQLNSPFENGFNFSIINSRVINNSHQEKRNFALINKGSNDGVEIEMGVIGANGILGIVNQVSPNYASVISILNLDLGINARLKNSPSFGTLRWIGKSPYKMQLNDIVATTNVALGDTVVSSGRSTYFPNGISLGTITDMEKPNTQGYYALEVTLFNSPIEMENVYILKNTDREEIKSLIEKNRQ